MYARMYARVHYNDVSILHKLFSYSIDPDFTFIIQQDICAVQKASVSSFNDKRDHP